MKKTILIIAVLLSITQWVVSEQVDTIVLLDTSMSMFPYYSGAIDYLIEDIVKQQLLVGDTFHLLSFNDYPEYEIARTIKGKSEITDILDRILLLQPVGKYTDLISAFSYLYQYVDKLKLNSIKNILILTDGIHDPPPDSPYPVSDSNKDDIIKIAGNMRRQGWNVSLIQFPISEINTNKKSGNSVPAGELTTSDNNSQSDNNLFPSVAKTLNKNIIPFRETNTSINHEVTGSPEIIYPGDCGRVGFSFKASFSVINHSADPVLLNLTKVNSEGKNLLDKPVIIKLNPSEEKPMIIVINLPENTKKGSHTTGVELIFGDNFRAYPRKGSLNYFFDPEFADVRDSSNTRFILYIIIGIVFLVILFYILINVFRNFKLPSYSNSKYVQKGKIKYETAGSPNKYYNSTNAEKSGTTDQIAIEMIVKNQNRRIGQRNIHYLEENHPRSVGGAGSEYFLIFIIATGKRIGEIILKDGQINFIPKNKEFFPDLAGKNVVDCLGKSIRVLNRNGVETSIIFRKWISPVERLNRLMHLTDESGLPNFKF